jgi:peroxiredoxin
MQVSLPCPAFCPPKVPARMFRPRSAAALLGLTSGWLLAIVVFAAEADKKPKPAESPPGHSVHGEAFNEGPRQAARLMPGTGVVSFPVTSKTPKVQEFVDQGVGQLHGFWYFEAERSFRQAAALDPKCAIAYWGMAMANVNNAKRAKGFIAEAAKQKAGSSPREILWIDALDEYYREAKDKKKDSDRDRRRQYIRRLENIVHEYPDDLEAKAFLICQIWLNSDKGLAINSHEAVDALISDVLDYEPNHPVHHYRIHLWDDEKPSRALGSAALCGPAAPGIAHMWHMPGHTYSKLTRYADAAWQQEASSRVDHRQMTVNRVLPDQIHNYAHNQEWLIRDLVYLGRARQAIELAKNMIELPRHPRFNTVTGKGSSYYGRLRLIEALERFELWDELIALADTDYLEPTDDRGEQLKRLRMLGAAHFARGHLEAAQAQVAEIEKRLAAAVADKPGAIAKAEEKARQAKKSADEIKRAKTDAEKEADARIKPLESVVAELAGHRALAAGDYRAALTHFEKAGGQSKEFLSRVQLAAGDKAKAEQLAREAVTQGKNQVYPLANLVDILRRLDKTSEAVKTFHELRGLSSQLDLDLPICERLKPLVREQGLPDDWRLPATVAADVGERPALESLGPLRWQPFAAPAWKLSGPNGQVVSLEQYRGKPVVLIFYLGFGCVHCVEQLQAFAPMALSFTEAGISLVAISTDSPDALRSSLAVDAGRKPPWTFPLLSDEKLDVFKSYGAFDDFEHRPLHATVLVDGQGSIRWQDISYQPFTDASFLYKEAQRLLHSPATSPVSHAPARLIRK